MPSVLDEEGLLSPIVGRSFPIETQQRMLCYLLIQCFREDQDFEEMMTYIRHMIKNLLNSLETFVPRLLFAETSPRWRLEKGHHKEVKNFIEKVAQGYGILGNNSIETGSEAEFVHASSVSTVPVINAGNDSCQENCLN